MDYVIHSQSNSINNRKHLDDKSKGSHQVNFSSEEYWYNILYAVGSYMVDNAKKNLMSSNTHSIDDNIITRLFCGYWVLYTIAINSERTKADIM